jgi:ABC-type lipoprotein release transport system permease subunit
MDAYPVKIKWPDVFATVALIILITFLAAVHPARLAVKKLSLKEL